MSRDSLALLLTGLVIGLAPEQGRATEPAPTETQVRFFETNIRPVLAEHCYQCHGPSKQKADLRLDKRQAILKGGESGPTVTIGDPKKSLLIQAVRHENDALQMPPSKKLTDRQIADLTQWVRTGLFFPPERAAGTFWAFVPPADPPVPAVKDVAWPASPLDRFV